MRLRILLLVCIFPHCLWSAEPSSWPAWVGQGQGDPTIKEKGVDEDDHTGFDYGTDSWGAWANLELTNKAGDILATVEMRYIEVAKVNYGSGLPSSGIYTMGAPEEEVGAHMHERAQINVPASDLNGGNAFWVSASECTQELWEQLHILNGDIVGLTDLEEFSPEAARGQIDTVYFLMTDSDDLEKDKKERAVESQTLANVKGFCTKLQAHTGVSRAIRLPTEKEWEYICRAGTATAFWSGRILSGVIEEGSPTANVEPENLLYDPLEETIRDSIIDNRKGDPAQPDVHPPWDILVNTVDLDGRASFNRFQMTIVIGGSIKVTSADLNIVVAHYFDDRYQVRYACDYFGDYTPILMVYEKVGTRYEPRPYADPSGPGLYYRYLDFGEALDDSDFIPTSNLTVARGLHNLRYKNENSVSDNLKAGDVPGDYYDGQQLEYREMIFVHTKYDGSGVENEDGDYIKDALGFLHPIRSRYHPAPVWTSGLAARKFTTFPKPSYDNDFDTLARDFNMSAAGDPPMTLNEYVEIVKDAIVDAYDGTGDFPNDFYTGPATGVKTFAGFNEGVPKSRMIDETTVTIAPGAQSGVQFNREPGRNPWGLLDVHGNVEEWVDTAWDGRSDHSNHQTGPYYITRGGSWRTNANKCRSAARTARDPNKAYDDVGFRFIIEH